jgi:hypothetical protein
MSGDVLSGRALNRATLERQLLLRRAKMPVLDAIEHLAGLQAQAPFPPYFGLWARLHGFRPEHLSQLILDREVVRLALMRGTVHLVTAADALAWRPLVQVLFDRDLATNTQFASGLIGLDLDELTATTRKLLAERPHTSKELGVALGKRWPERDAAALVHAARGRLPLVQVPPRGIWGKAGQPTFSTAEDWLGGPLEAGPSPEKLVLRYLRAFGPATVMDAQTWAGITRLSEVFDRLRPRLRKFRDEDGRDLFDLPDAPRPDPATPAPPRFLGPFDQMILSYADRSRVLSEDHRKLVITHNGLVKGTLLVDGSVGGLWEITRRQGAATLLVSQFTGASKRGTLSKRDTDSLASAGARLLKFAEPGADTHDVRFTTLD